MEKDMEKDTKVMEKDTKVMKEDTKVMDYVDKAIVSPVVKEVTEAVNKVGEEVKKIISNANILLCELDGEAAQLQEEVAILGNKIKITTLITIMVDDIKDFFKYGTKDKEGIDQMKKSFSSRDYKAIEAYTKQLQRYLERIKTRNEAVEKWLEMAMNKFKDSAKKSAVRVAQAKGSGKTAKVVGNGLAAGTFLSSFGLITTAGLIALGPLAAGVGTVVGLTVGSAFTAGGSLAIKKGGDSVANYYYGIEKKFSELQVRLDKVKKAIEPINEAFKVHIILSINGSLKDIEEHVKHKDYDSFCNVLDIFFNRMNKDKKEIDAMLSTLPGF